MLCVLLGISTTAYSRDKTTKYEGTWAVQKTFTQLNVACIKTYICTPKQAILHSADSKVSRPDPKAVTGVCSAAGGPVDSCDQCLTTPPNDECTVTVTSP